jgi:hypothetical protein
MSAPGRPVRFEIEPAHALGEADRHAGRSIGMRIAGGAIVTEHDDIAVAELAVQQRPFRLVGLRDVGGAVRAGGGGDAKRGDVVRVFLTLDDSEDVPLRDGGGDLVGVIERRSIDALDAPTALAVRLLKPEARLPAGPRAEAYA